MANVGTSTSGNTLIGQGNTVSPRFAPIGTDSSLTQYGLIIAEGTGPFEATSAATDGQVVIGATGANPDFGTLTSSDGSIVFTTGANTLDLTVDGGTTVGKTLTGDSGGALSPTAGNWNILGLSGSKTSGATSTLTVKSPPYADQGVGTVTLNSGSFVTGAVTITLPASVGLADGDLVEIISTNGVVTIQLVGTQVGHLGTSSTTAAGTFTGSATGDSISLRYQSSTDDWWATSSVGVWLVA